MTTYTREDALGNLTRKIPGYASLIRPILDDFATDESGQSTPEEHWRWVATTNDLDIWQWICDRYREGLAEGDEDTIANVRTWWRQHSPESIGLFEDNAGHLFLDDAGAPFLIEIEAAPRDTFRDAASTWRDWIGDSNGSITMVRDDLHFIAEYRTREHTVRVVHTPGSAARAYLGADASDGQP